MLNSKRNGQKECPLQWQKIQPIVQDLLRNGNIYKRDWFQMVAGERTICLWDNTDGAEALYNALRVEFFNFAIHF